MNNNEILNKVMIATMPNRLESEMDDVDKLIKYVVYNIFQKTVQQAPTIFPTDFPDDFVENTKLKNNFKRNNFKRK